MAVETAPERLIDGEGRPRVGVFDAPIRVLNAGDFRPPGGEKRVSPSRIKRWQYVGLVSEEFVIGAAVVWMQPVGNVFWYVFDRKRRELTEASVLCPFGRGIAFESNGVSGVVAWRKGKNRILLENGRAGGRRRLEIVSGKLAVTAELEDAPAPLVVASRVGYRGFNYTLKIAGMPAFGEVALAGATRRIGEREAFGVLDFTTGCLARETFWNWASGGGRDAGGALVGLNFVQGINETGVTENAFWIGDRLVKTDTLTFAYDDRQILSPWRIRSWDKKVDLTFVPEGERKADLDLKVVASRFHQPFGCFSGTLIDDAGVPHAVERLPGYTEEHFALW